MGDGRSTVSNSSNNGSTTDGQRACNSLEAFIETTVMLQYNSVFSLSSCVFIYCEEFLSEINTALTGE